ncbi:MAG: cupredoxin domain-containing protein [Candidatus Limnocylindria bacterium]
MIGRLPSAAGLVLALVTAGCAPPATAGETIEITIRYSRFSPAAIDVRAGAPVTIVLRNDDPIEHEWIVGTEEVHQRHRDGTDPVHDTLPEEVTVPALSTRVTTLTFPRPGLYLMICHLPGHEAYGMVGTVRVR